MLQADLRKLTLDPTQKDTYGFGYNSVHIKKHVVSIDEINKQMFQTGNLVTVQP